MAAVLKAARTLLDANFIDMHKPLITPYYALQLFVIEEKW